MKKIILLISFILTACGSSGFDVQSPTLADIRAAISANNPYGIVPGLALGSITLPACLKSDGSFVESDTSYEVENLPSWLSFDGTNRVLSLASGSTIPADAYTIAEVTYNCSSSNTASTTFTVNDLDGGGAVDGKEYFYGAVPLIDINGWFQLTPGNERLYRAGTTSAMIPTGVTKITAGMDPTNAADDTADSDGDATNNKDEIANGTNPFVYGTRGIVGGAGFYATGQNPIGIVAADFNSDGKIDLAMSDLTDDNVALWFGDGDGTFTWSGFTTVGDGPRGITAADFNNDGNMDLATANMNANSASIMLGNGDGTFTAAASTLSTGLVPAAIVPADFDNDGNVDIAVSNQNGNALSIHLGNGDGQFRAGDEMVTVGIGPGGICAADFNADGKIDLAAANYGIEGSGDSISVMLGKGDGTFERQTTYSSGGAPMTIVSADMNGDGYLDLVTSNEGDRSVTIFLGRGDGSFAAGTNEFTGAEVTKDGPRGIIAADLDGDNDIDLATANYGRVLAGASISVMLSAGDGTFESKVYYQTGATPWGIVGADFDNDGDIDISTANYGDDNIWILINQVP